MVFVLIKSCINGKKRTDAKPFIWIYMAIHHPELFQFATEIE